MIIRTNILVGWTVCVAFLSVFPSSINAQQNDICNTSELRSRSSNDLRELIVVNKTDRTTDLYWVDFEGKKKQYATLDPQGRHVQETYAGHVWAAENNLGYCDVIFTVENNVEIIIK